MGPPLKSQESGIGSKSIRIGQHVIFHDDNGRPHSALVTAIHGDPNYGDGDNGVAPLINLVLVSEDEKKQDSCGRQIERETSVSHASEVQGVHGFYWRHADEKPNPGITPVT